MSRKTPSDFRDRKGEYLFNSKHALCPNMPYYDYVLMSHTECEPTGHEPYHEFCSAIPPDGVKYCRIRVEVGS